MASTVCGKCGLAAGILLLLALLADAQQLRFSNHRRVSIPDYATLRVGPFYSTMSFSQSAGYRYTTSSGSGTDFLVSNERGRIREDGSEFPLVSTLNFRNYLLVSQTMDVDMSVAISYSHFPLGTQDDEFMVNLAEEGIIGDLSTEFELTPFLKGTVYDSAIYKTDYIDTRGISDVYGGSQYTFFHNLAGVNLDWLMAEDKNMAFSASRSDNLPKADAFADQKLTAYAESVGYEQRLNEFVSAGLSADFAQNLYPAATNRPDSSSQSYSAHTSARLTQYSVGSASLGYAWGSTSGGGEDSSGGSDNGSMTASLSLQTQLAKNLSHAISYGRSQRAGFNSPFEIYNSYSYTLGWKGDLTSAGLFSILSAVDPQSLSVNKYSDWQSGVNVSYPVYVNLPLVIGEDFGQYVRLSLSSAYDVRDNGALPAGETVEPEWSANYNTWISRIGTSFPFIWADILFAAYVEHMDRTSDNPQLAYQRDILEITLTYTHEF